MYTTVINILIESKDKARNKKGIKEVLRESILINLDFQIPTNRNLKFVSLKSLVKSKIFYLLWFLQKSVSLLQLFSIFFIRNRWFKIPNLHQKIYTTRIREN